MIGGSCLKQPLIAAFMRPRRWISAGDRGEAIRTCRLCHRENKGMHASEPNRARSGAGRRDFQILSKKKG
jgi:hypothetical protein